MISNKLHVFYLRFCEDEFNPLMHNIPKWSDTLIS